MANIERIKEVVNLIEGWEAAPNGQYKFNMASWICEITPELVNGTEGAEEWKCGTSACFAGAAAIHGGAILRREGFLENRGQLSTVILPNGVETSIEEWATKYLGLSYSEANEIFYSTDVEDSTQLKGAINYYLNDDIFPGVPVYVDPSNYEDDYYEDDDPEEYAAGCECEECVSVTN